MSSLEDTDLLLKKYRLSVGELEKIRALLGRDPQGVEWALFSALWSEHCSYKSSKIHLKKFRYRNIRVLESEGENAGLVDLGEGERIAFKMESHNHPSFIEPFQGAATGVGGILRDIFTMGARPIALADYLCFGTPEAPRMPSLVQGVVKGISFYGNCVGVPTITGQTQFFSQYNQNILVNAMAVGLLTEKMKVAKSKANFPGQWVVYVGSKTGKDGVHGASMASESFGTDSDSKKPNVQIGDPFMEKLLIEACLEVIDQDLVLAMQDMGAAGLTSSSFEMAAKGGVGFKMDLSLVPLRDLSMTPEEILLSESQERMLLICEPKKFPELEKVFSRWGLEACRVGEVVSDQKMRLHWKGEEICSVDPRWMVDEAPIYQRPYTIRKEFERTQGDFKAISYTEAFSRLQKNINLCSKSWITSQYDQRVGLRTARGAEESMALLRLPSGRGLALSVGCRSELMKVSPRLGALDAVFYPALQMASKGARALAVTDCLNFGNPEKVEIMSEFVESVEAIAEAAQVLDAPVVSGNVSLYNETLGRNIISTPATGLIGLRGELENSPQDRFIEEGHKVYLVSDLRARVWSRHGTWDGKLDLVGFKAFIDRVRESSVLAQSSKCVGELGLLGTLAQMTRGGVGLLGPASGIEGLGPEWSEICPLYAVIFAVKEEDEDKFRSFWQSSAIELGKTQKKKMNFIIGDLHWQGDLEDFHARVENLWAQTWGLN